MTLSDRIVPNVEHRPGITNRELSVAVFGTPNRAMQINNECAYLAQIGRIERRREGSEPYRNYPVRKKPTLTVV